MKKPVWIAVSVVITLLGLPFTLRERA